MKNTRFLQKTESKMADTNPSIEITTNMNKLYTVMKMQGWLHKVNETDPCVAERRHTLKLKCKWVKVSKDGKMPDEKPA